MSLYKESNTCCFYLVYRLEKVTHSAPNQVKQDMGMPPGREVKLLPSLIISESLKELQLLSTYISVQSFWPKVIFTALEAQV